MKSLLDKLGLREVNAGSCTGPDGWLESGGHLLTSYNPTTGEAIAQVEQTTGATYEQVVDKATAAFQTWREDPAPRRGQMIRDLGDAVRE